MMVYVFLETKLMCCILYRGRDMDYAHFLWIRIPGAKQALV